MPGEGGPWPQNPVLDGTLNQHTIKQPGALPPLFEGLEHRRLSFNSPLAHLVLLLPRLGSSSGKLAEIIRKAEPMLAASAQSGASVNMCKYSSAFMLKVIGAAGFG